MNQIKLIRLTEVIELTGLGKSTVWMYIQQGKFPKQIKISPRISVWKLSDIEAWISKQIEQGEKND